MNRPCLLGRNPKGKVRQAEWPCQHSAHDLISFEISSSETRKQNHQPVERNSKSYENIYGHRNKHTYGHTVHLGSDPASCNSLATAYETTTSCSPTSSLVLQLNYKKARRKGDRAYVCPGEMMHLNTASTDRTDVVPASK